MSFNAKAMGLLLRSVFELIKQGDTFLDPALYCKNCILFLKKTGNLRECEGSNKLEITPYLKIIALNKFYKRDTL